MNLKFQFFLMIGLIVIAAWGCRAQRNVCADCDLQEDASAAAVQPVECNNCDRATKAEMRYVSYLRQRFRRDSIAVNNYLHRKGKHVNVMSAEVEVDFAQEYIGQFSKHQWVVRKMMGANYRNSFSFDSTTLGAFASLYCQGKIDGIRAYVAKYDKNPRDSLANTIKHYTVILVGTKAYDSAGKTYYRDTLIKTLTDPNLGPDVDQRPVFIDLQDYSNPCKPTPCPGSQLPTMSMQKVAALLKI